MRHCAKYHNTESLISPCSEVRKLKKAITTPDTRRNTAVRFLTSIRQRVTDARVAPWGSWDSIRNASCLRA